MVRAGWGWVWLLLMIIIDLSGKGTTKTGRHEGREKDD